MSVKVVSVTANHRGLLEEMRAKWSNVCFVYTCLPPDPELPGALESIPRKKSIDVKARMALYAMAEAINQASAELYFCEELSDLGKGTGCMVRFYGACSRFIPNYAYVVREVEGKDEAGR